MWLAAATLARGDTTAAKQLLQMSLAGYVNRLRSPASAYPSAAELVEALVIAAYIYATQHHREEAATAVGCAEALRAQACAPSDPFLIVMADHVREQLTRNMGPDALYTAMERGRTTSALACFTAGISETNSIAHNSNTVEQ